MKYIILFNFEIMRNSFLIMLIASIFIFSCKEQEKEEKEPIVQKKATQEVSKSTRCYSFSKNKDSIYLKLSTLADSIVEGNLTYNFFEKDRNQGSLKGKWIGDSLFADYEFDAEGTTSTREVFFFKKDSGLVEGYGPVKDSLDKVVFQDHKTLVLNENILLKPTNCD